MHAIVAVKDLRSAKSRLATELDADARADLVLAMLHDTLAAVSDVAAIDGVTVVTPDPTVAALAYAAGVHVYADPMSSDRSEVSGTSQPSGKESSLNSALSAAASHIRAESGRVDLVVLQADLPSLQPGELFEALTDARTGGRSIVVDHHGTGTAALFSCDPDLPLDPRFGPESARGHTDSGARRLIGDWPGLRTDVDTGTDLETVRALGVGPATRASLKRLNRTASNTR
ncbi:2-phospho-L-lactate guanylyltransferase [Rhodococcus sp. ARC_M6]|uniref:2-phospho-L-lactate guanylyltransferase n=1 Tax=Rhodococcus sp. ARC_M6 TaxID=2928852 RepID=UPI001FB29757|nr:2-phospho-L-lactate guanylyltransferase [Rhodococcus sp. ARC_M6]MCJ0904880.1 2-phospho-L-lactate guanylyltransferase [Rhodococcus sp. ARC_M6]